MAEHDRLNVVCELQEGHSAKESCQRPVYNQLMKGLREGDYNAVLTRAHDRLSRNAGDLGSVVDLIDQGKLLYIRTYSQTFTNNPNEKFLLVILCSQAKLENDIIPDPERAEIVSGTLYKASKGRSGRRLKQWLDGLVFTNRSGKPTPLSDILAMLLNPFYYGEFQYPEDSDARWYQGTLKPLISKELFEQVQQTGEFTKAYGVPSNLLSVVYYCAGPAERR